MINVCIIGAGNSAKRRTRISYLFFLIRVLTSKHIKYFEINRYDIKEI